MSSRRGRMCESSNNLTIFSFSAHFLQNSDPAKSRQIGQEWTHSKTLNILLQKKSRLTRVIPTFITTTRVNYQYIYTHKIGECKIYPCSK